MLLTNVKLCLHSVIHSQYRIQMTDTRTKRIQVAEYLTDVNNRPLMQLDK